VAERLAGWLNGVCVATVVQDRRRLRHSYAAEALDHLPLGSPVLSLSLPWV